MKQVETFQQRFFTFFYVIKIRFLKYRIQNILIIRLAWRLTSESFINSRVLVKREQELHESWEARVCLRVSSTLMSWSNENKSCMRVEKREFAWEFHQLSCPGRTRTRVAYKSWWKASWRAVEPTRTLINYHSCFTNSLTMSHLCCSGQQGYHIEIDFHFHVALWLPVIVLDNIEKTSNQVQHALIRVVLGGAEKTSPVCITFLLHSLHT